MASIFSCFYVCGSSEFWLFLVGLNQAQGVHLQVRLDLFQIFHCRTNSYSEHALLIAMAGTQESKPEYTAVFKVFLMSHLLLFHWQRQVTWPSSTVTDKESNRQGGKTYSVYIKARYA